MNPGLDSTQVPRKKNDASYRNSRPAHPGPVAGMFRTRRNNDEIFKVHFDGSLVAVSGILPWRSVYADATNHSGKFPYRLL